MPILDIITIHEAGRNAKTVDEFYYAEAEPLPYGVRALTADFIQEGKIINRYVCLHESGDTLTITTMFRDSAARQEWFNHPTMDKTKAKWADRDWTLNFESIPCHDIVDVAAWHKQ